MPLETLLDLAPTLPTIEIVDVGANPLYGPPPYQPLLDRGRARVTGFEPEAEAFRALTGRNSPRERYLPYVVGDGSECDFWSLAHPGMSSIYEPDLDLMSYFGHRQNMLPEDEDFVARSQLRSRATVKTTRLDDIDEVTQIDYLKIDVQGAELKVFEGATETLRTTLIIQTEAMFLPMYKKQPLFVDLDRFLTAQGFLLHRFVDMEHRPVHTAGNRHYQSLEPLGDGQLFWSDAVFVRNFMTLADTTPPAKLVQLAVILHDIYGSYDLVHYLLTIFDRLSQTSIAPEYRRSMRG